MAHSIAPPPQERNRRQATAVRRRHYASLPRGYRIAGLLVVLSADALSAFGRAVYAEFVLAAVRGLPDTAEGKPASDLMQDVSRKGPQALPDGYGRPFATRVYKILLAKFGDLDLVEEAMSHVLFQIARRKVHVANGATLQAAEGFVITIALNGARSLLRQRSRHRERSLVVDDEQSLDIEDPQAFEQLDRLLPTKDLMAILTEIEKIHPRAPEWLRARLQGDTGAEIAAEWGTTPSYVSRWQAQYLSRIERAVRNHLRIASQPYSYDRRISVPIGEAT
jgi:DNA-directed RNA polymerase specialized sigma24 family protein